MPADVLAKEKEIVLAQMANDPKTANKPDAIKEKMAIGKLGKFYKENCLVDQAFIKDGGMDVKSTLPIPLRLWAATSRSLRTPTSSRARAWRSATEDFAAEVAAAIKG